MPILSGRKQQWVSLAMPVSYRVNETRERLRDSKNIFPNQGRISTRYGARRYNSTSLGGSILSSSYFRDTASNRYLLGKVGTVLYSVKATGAHTSVKTGLTSTTKHSGVTLNNRHIIGIESDGLFSWDGTTFTQLGQAAPAAPTIAVQGAGLAVAAYVASYTFYDSVHGFESNQSANSNTITTVGAGAQGLRVTMATTAANANIDKKRIYLKAGTGAYLFIAEIALATATYDIAADATSTTTPPTTHAPPLSGGGKYLVPFGSKLAVMGNSTYKNDVQISESDLPDAFDDSVTSSLFTVPGDGEITAGGCGYYNNSVMDPYLIIFKKTSTHLYSEIGGFPRQVLINDKIGCVSHNTVHVKDGDIYFLSQNGWYKINNGTIVRDQNGVPVTLASGDIDDIFRSPGFIYEANQSQLSNAHSVYYSKDDLWLTFLAEGSSTSFNRAYAYDFKVNGFYPFEFQPNVKTSVNGEDSSGYETLFLGDDSGTFFTYSSINVKTDNNTSAVDSNIPAMAMLAWFGGDNDFEKSFSFVELSLKAITSANAVLCNTWVNYSLAAANQQNYSYDFPTISSGFILDESVLDEGVLSDGRDVALAHKYIKRTGRNIIFSFSQEIADASMELIAAQLEYFANGNRN